MAQIIAIESTQAMAALTFAIKNSQDAMTTKSRPRLSRRKAMKTSKGATRQFNPHRCTSRLVGAFFQVSRSSILRGLLARQISCRFKQVRNRFATGMKNTPSTQAGEHVNPFACRARAFRAARNSQIAKVRRAGQDVTSTQDSTRFVNRKCALHLPSWNGACPCALRSKTSTSAYAQVEKATAAPASNS